MAARREVFPVLGIPLVDLDGEAPLKMSTSIGIEFDKCGHHAWHARAWTMEPQ